MWSDVTPALTAAAMSHLQLLHNNLARCKTAPGGTAAPQRMNFLLANHPDVQFGIQGIARC